MTAPFVPKAEVPQWRLVYDELCRLDVGDVLTYDRLSEVLGFDFTSNRTPYYKAAQVWGQEHKRALRPVNGVGYRVVDAPEHEDIARRYHRKSRRALRRSARVIENADRSRLSAADRARFDAMELTLSRQQQQIGRLTARLEQVERAVVASDLSQRVERLEQAVLRASRLPLEAAS